MDIDKIALVTSIQQVRQDTLKMELNYKLPYNEWLYHILEDKLILLGFVVYHRDKSYPKAPAPVSEYIYCKSDILVYHEVNVESNIAASQISVSKLSLEETEGVNVINLNAGVAELKVGAVDTATENELFCNMFGKAANLSSKVLYRGKVVRHVTDITTKLSFGTLPVRKNLDINPN